MRWLLPILNFLQVASSGVTRQGQLDELISNRELGRPPVVGALAFWYMPFEWFPNSAIVGYAVEKIAGDNIFVESVYDLLPDGILVRLASIARSDHQSLYDVSGSYPPLVVQYSTWCEDESAPVDTTAKSYWFLKALRKTGIAPRALFLSAPIGAPKYMWTTSGAKIDATECREVDTRVGVTDVEYVISNSIVGRDIQSSTRMMLMEKTGPSMGELMRRNGVLPLASAIKYTLTMLQVLETLHSHKFLHGNVHLGTFVLPAITESDNRYGLKMIEFEKGRIFHKSEYESDWCSSFSDTPTDTFFALSPWESYGCRYSFRDDIFRVIQLLPAMIYGNVYMNTVENLSKEKRGEILFQLKARGDIFEFNSLQKVRNQVFKKSGKPKSVLRTLSSGVARFGLEMATPKYFPPDKLESIRTSLAYVMDLIVRMVINERAPFEAINKRLNAILDLITA